MNKILKLTSNLSNYPKIVITEYEVVKETKHIYFTKDIITTEEKKIWKANMGLLSKKSKNDHYRVSCYVNNDQDEIKRRSRQINLALETVIFEELHGVYLANAKLFKMVVDQFYIQNDG